MCVLNIFMEIYSVSNQLEATEASADEEQNEASMESTLSTDFTPTSETSQMTHTSFTFQYPLPSKSAQPSSTNLKCDNNHIDAPTPPSSPAKKRTQVDINNASPPSRHIESHDISPLIFPISRPATPNPTQLAKSGPRNKITSYWKIATPTEKEEMNQRHFQKIADNYEKATADAEEDKRRKLARGRTLVRERQQAHRDRSREKKIEAGWVPGKKRVRRFFKLRALILILDNLRRSAPPSGLRTTT
jgi:hypothetical protein